MQFSKGTEVAVPPAGTTPTTRAASKAITRRRRQPRAVSGGGEGQAGEPAETPDGGDDLGLAALLEQARAAAGSDTSHPAVPLAGGDVD